MELYRSYTSYTFWAARIHPYPALHHGYWLQFVGAASLKAMPLLPFPSCVSLNDLLYFMISGSKTPNHIHIGGTGLWGKAVAQRICDLCFFLIIYSIYSMLPAWHHGFRRGKSFRVSPKWWQCCCSWSISSLAVQNSTFRGGRVIHPGFCRRASYSASPKWWLCCCLRRESWWGAWHSTSGEGCVIRAAFCVWSSHCVSPERWSCCCLRKQFLRAM